MFSTCRSSERKQTKILLIHSIMYVSVSILSDLSIKPSHVFYSRSFEQGFGKSQLFSQMTLQIASKSITLPLEIGFFFFFESYINEIKKVSTEIRVLKPIFLHFIYIFCDLLISCTGQNELGHPKVKERQPLVNLIFSQNTETFFHSMGQNLIRSYIYNFSSNFVLHISSLLVIFLFALLRLYFPGLWISLNKA